MFAKVGDEVFYNGDLEYVNKDIKELLNDHFTIGNPYKIRYKSAHENGDTYYKFYGFYFNYPLKCFDLYRKETIKMHLK